MLVIQPETWNVLDANDYAAYILNVDLDVIIGSSIPQFKRIYKLLQKSSGPKVLSELSIVSATGVDIMLEVSARFVKIDNEFVIQAIARDISEQHIMTDKMVQADRMVILGQLVAGISHDIRNPLSAVNLNLQLLQRNVAEDTIEREYVDTALEAAERILKIVETIRGISKPTIVELKPITLNKLIPTVIDLTASSIKKKNIIVEIDLAENLADVSADAQQLYRVFINLITNASDAIAINKNGRIIIKTYNEAPHTQQERGFAVVSIEDNGCGIDEDDLQKIFEPFFTRKAEGTGLGLPNAQGIVHQHGGIIEVESKVGQGTTFYVKIPMLWE